MKITSIEKKSGTRYTIEVDGEYWYIVDQEIIFDCGLKRDLEVSEDFLKQVRQRAEERKCRERAYHLLEIRDYSEQELYEKLCSGVSKEIAAKTVARMIELGLVRDEDYAAKLAEYLLTVKKVSRRHALYEMQRKGIGRELAENSLEAIEITPQEQLNDLIQHKYLRRLKEPDGRRKVAAALMRQGFGYSDIQHALDAWTEEEDDSWQFE